MKKAQRGDQVVLEKGADRDEFPGGFGVVTTVTGDGRVEVHWFATNTRTWQTVDDALVFSSNFPC